MRVPLLSLSLAVAVVGPLGACSKPPRQSDEAAIAQVEAAQKQRAPVRPITPQPILYPDITKAKLLDAGCAFVADGGGMGAVFMGQGDRGAIKLADGIVILAADKGSARLPQTAWSRYSGRDYALTLTRMDGSDAKTQGAVESFAGQLVITDPDDRPVYSAHGTVQCRPS